MTENSTRPVTPVLGCPFRGRKARDLGRASMTDLDPRAEARAIIAETFAMLRMGRRILEEDVWAPWDGVAADLPRRPEDLAFARSLGDQADWLGSALVRWNAHGELLAEVENLLDFFRMVEEAAAEPSPISRLTAFRQA